MNQNDQDSSLETLQEIRSIMDRSARFITLSGLSGVWAGLSALAGAWVAYGWLNGSACVAPGTTVGSNDALTLKLVQLGIVVFIVALLGALFFTYRKTSKSGQKIWNTASKQMLLHGSIPLLAGGVFCLAFIYHGNEQYIAACCLIFYGLALVSGSKYTFSDIMYLGLLELMLGAVCLFFPCFGLYFWAIGFGILHILYGLMMWNKYDKRIAQ